jgi:uncharacterized protein with NRDE domain
MHPTYKLILAANRDEYYNRPTNPAAWWKTNPNLLAGIDLKSKGTWLGITKNGKIAAVTNYREKNNNNPNAISRGKLVSDFLTSPTNATEYLETLHTKKNQYNGFNLIVGNIHDNPKLYFFSNRNNNTENPEPLKQGLYGLSNATLNTPWPKIQKGKHLLEQALNQPDVSPETVFEILADTEIAPDDRLPDTGVGMVFERILSPMFIKAPGYGTRSSTVLLVDHHNRVTFIEKSFVPPAVNEYRFGI